MRRRVYLENPYVTVLVEYTEDGLCRTETREGVNEITIDELVERFNRLPTVQTYGITESCIIDLDTGERTHFRTKWNDIFEERTRISNLHITSQIERLVSRLR